MHIVDGIVEPQGRLDLTGLIGRARRCVEMGEAFGQVLQGMVMALRLVASRQQRAEQAGRQRLAEVELTSG